MPTPGMREISEEEFLRNEQLRRLATAMLQNPKSRPHIMAAQKLAFPNAHIPEIDNLAPVREAIDGISKTVNDFIKEQKDGAAKKAKDDADAAAEARWNKGRDKLRERGVLDEGVKKVEEFMAQTGIVDHEIGWAAFSKLNPEPTPLPSSNGGGINGFLEQRTDGGDDLLKQLIETKGDDAALNSIQDKLIHQALFDIGGQRPFGR